MLWSRSRKLDNMGRKWRRGEKGRKSLLKIHWHHVFMREYGVHLYFHFKMIKMIKKEKFCFLNVVTKKSWNVWTFTFGHTSVCYSKHRGTLSLCTLLPDSDLSKLAGPQAAVFMCLIFGAIICTQYICTYMTSLIHHRQVWTVHRRTAFLLVFSRAALYIHQGHLFRIFEHLAW